MPVPVAGFLSKERTCSMYFRKFPRNSGFMQTLKVMQKSFEHQCDCEITLLTGVKIVLQWEGGSWSIDYSSSMKKHPSCFFFLMVSFRRYYF